MPVKEQREQLLKVLRLTKEILELPENDFVWSGWDDAQTGIREVDGFISAIENEQTFDEFKLSILFAPTGPIQEVSVSSGWGDAFLGLAADFDAALAAFQNAERFGK